MLKKILVIVIIITSLYQLYTNFYKENNIVPKGRICESDQEESDDEKYIDKDGVENNSEILSYGKPHTIKQDEKGPYYLWKFDQPEPWSQITYRPSDEFVYSFWLKIQVPSLEHYRKWKSVIPNLEFNSKTSEIIIPANDEEGALSVANLIINHFNDKIKFKTIMKKNLIDISIAKAKKFPMVKNKLKEQIMEELYGINMDDDDEEEMEFKEDLARAQGTIEGPHAYGGNEYSFL